MKSQRGFFMMVAVILVVVVGLIGLAVTNMFVSATNSNNHYVQNTTAFYIAESGLEMARHYINANNISCTAINGTATFTNATRFNGILTVTGTAGATIDTLTTAMTATSTTIAVNDVTGFAANGTVIIDNEVMQYASISGTSLINVVRGVGGTLAATHAVNASVTQNQCLLSATAGVPSISNPWGLANASTILSTYAFSYDLGATNQQYTPAFTLSSTLGFSNTGTIQNSMVTTQSTNYAGANIISNGATTINNTAVTQVNSASGIVTSSSSSTRLADISASNTNVTSANMFALFFNQSQATVQANSTTTYTNTTINGVTGKMIWFTSALNITGSITVGSPASPVILIVNNNATIGTGVNIYGFVYVLQALTMSGGTIHGAVAATSATNLTGASSITYNEGILANAIQLNTYGNMNYNNTPVMFLQTF